MRVEFFTDRGVAMPRDVDSIADCDRELGTAVQLREFRRTGGGRHHPSSRRHATNLDGLIDALLDARTQLAELEAAELSGWWAASWPGEREPAWGQSGVGA